MCALRVMHDHVTRAVLPAPCTMQVWAVSGCTCTPGDREWDLRARTWSDMKRVQKFCSGIAMQAYEKLGVFYLGRYHDLAARKTLPDLLLYNSNDLLTHALCVGMTGSGKTGLCFDIIEEAAIDGIPAILIDPEGRSRPICC